jgi:hypothetical protein
MNKGEYRTMSSVKNPDHQLEPLPETDAPVAPLPGNGNGQDGLQQLISRIDVLYRQAEIRAVEADIDACKDVEPPEEIDLGAAWEKAEYAFQLFTSQCLRAQDLALAVQDQAAKYEDLQEKKAAQEVERQRLQALETKLQGREEELASRENAQLKLLVELDSRERNAEAGFLRERRELLAEVDEWAREFREELAAQRRELDSARLEALEALNNELQELRTHEHEKLDAERQALLADREALDKERLELEAQQHRCERERQELELEKELLGEDRQALSDLIDRRAADRVLEYESAIERYKRVLTQAQADREDLQSQLAQKDAALQRFGHQRPEEVLAKLQLLQEKCERLQNELDSRPQAEDLQRLRALEREREGWMTDRHDFQRKVQELNRRLTMQQTAVTELETLRDQRDTYKSTIDVLRQSLNELRDEIRQDLADGSARPVFPSLTDVDSSSILQSSISFDEAPSLAELVERLQQDLALGSTISNSLYYTQKDIRSFLAGLSMSYLTILQGISGTGKTSLPEAIAGALGGGHTRVEVQAGWRDRQDLVGHYNSFEGKFYESKFLRALYEAQCPAYRDALYIIVLDEMNLSYPEQYFADILSAQEGAGREDPVIELLTEPMADGRVPKLLVNQGRCITIPPNVRFVGTANQDETTKDVADKTYDRAHVMELPVERPNFSVSPSSTSPLRLSFASLQERFREAKRRHGAEARRCKEFFNDFLRDRLARDFGLGWGNRLERQIGDYVPVVVAAGGTLTEAADYLLAMKVLRKMRGRYENQNRTQELRDLQEEIVLLWEWLGDKQEPTQSRSHHLIAEELKRWGME